MWLVFALLSAITASLVAIFGKLGLKNIDPTLATTLRSVVMTFFLLFVSLSLKKFSGFSMISFTSKDWLLILFSALFGALSWLFYFYALKFGAASHVAVIDRLSLVFVIILAVIFLKEKLTFNAFIGVILIIIGAILITLK